MKVAHLIMVHKYPQQLEELIRALDHPDFYIFIHLDKKIPMASFTYLGTMPRVTFIRDRGISNWGGFSFVECVLASLKEILKHPLHFNFFNLLSGQDYPIKPINQIADFFKENLDKCYISFDKEHQKEWWSHAVTRYEHYHFTDKTFKGRYVVQWILNKLLPKRKFPLDIKLFGSSDSSWWAISKDAVQCIVDFTEQEKKTMKFMKYTWCADEFFFATILMNSRFKHTVVNNNLRLINWKEGSPNPIILSHLNFDEIKNSEKFFARKFDMDVDYDIMKKIEKDLL